MKSTQPPLPFGTELRRSYAGRQLKFLLFYIVIFISASANAQAPAEDITYGLSFNSYLSQPSERTMLTLDEAKPFRFHKTIRLGAKIRIRAEKRQYGFILRMISESGDNIDIILALHAGGDTEIPYLAAVYNDTKRVVCDTIRVDRWEDMSVTVDREAGVLSVGWAGAAVEVEIPQKGFSALALSFGKCLHNEFQTDDVAPFDLRDISIAVDGKETRMWELRKYDGDVCYDLLHSSPARALNPRWLIDGHYSWKRAGSVEIPNDVQVAFDQSKEILYIVRDKASVDHLDLSDMSFGKTEVVSGVPATSNFSQLVADTINDVLVSFKIDEGRVSVFDHGERRWSRERQVFPKSVHWHHTAVFNPADTTILSFGGYGYYKYNNLLTIFHLNRDTVTRRVLEGITPRYSAASCIVGGDLYIYGGRGSESGMQEVGTVYLYDLFKMNIASGEVSRIGDFPAGDTPFLPAGNMVYNPVERCFYTITDAGGGRLLRISPDEGAARFVASPFDVAMSANHFYRNLFHSPRLNRLFAVFDTYDDATKKASLDIFSLAYPPLPITEVVQTPPPSQARWWIAGVAILLAAAVSGFLLWRKRSKRGGAASVPTSAPTSVPVSASADMASLVLPTEPSKELRDRSAIFLLGGFRILDSSGKNISSKFTPTLRELLLLLILRAGDGKGILSARIEEQLWGDKDKAAARNNRYVSMRKLRLLLAEVGTVNISGNNDYWTIEFGGDVYCDYRELAECLASKGHSAPDGVVAPILLAGPLLPQIELEWLDQIKSTVSNEVVDALHEILKRHPAAETKVRLKIAETILLHDVLNEEAMFIKCRILYTDGKKSLSASAYDSFSREYRTLLGEEYRVTFDDIVSRDPD